MTNNYLHYNVKQYYDIALKQLSDKDIIYRMCFIRIVYELIEFIKNLNFFISVYRFSIFCVTSYVIYKNIICIHKVSHLILQRQICLKLYFILKNDWKMELTLFWGFFLVITVHFKVEFQNGDHSSFQVSPTIQF